MSDDHPLLLVYFVHTYTCPINFLELYTNPQTIFFLSEWCSDKTKCLIFWWNQNFLGILIGICNLVLWTLELSSTKLCTFWLSLLLSSSMKILETRKHSKTALMKKIQYVVLIICLWDKNNAKLNFRFYKQSLGITTYFNEKCISFHIKKLWILFNIYTNNLSLFYTIITYFPWAGVV